MSPVAAPSDKRFRRAHVKPARRRRLRTLLGPLAKYGVVMALLLVGLYESGSVVAHARVLQIDRITVRGNAQLSNGQVATLLSGLRGESILWSDLRTWRMKLLTSPWVKDAAFRRVLPSTVEVVVQERQPIGLARMRGQLYLIDEEGLAIDRFGPAYSGFDLPIVDGLSDARTAGEAEANAERAVLAARVAAALRTVPDLGDRLSQIEVSDPRNAGVILKGDPAVIFIGADRFLQRLQSYLQLAGRLRESVPVIDSVDLRFDPQIVVRPAGHAVQAASPGSERNQSATAAARKKR